jgi:hypothetical protein
MNVSNIQQSQKLPPVIADLAAKARIDGMTQKRSGGQCEGMDDKFRVTLETRQAVLNWFADGSASPTSMQIPPILIVHGVHCRMSNISDDRKWLEDEEFTVAGHTVFRKKGQKVGGNLMAHWSALRASNPQFFLDVVVMQQPSATCDEIIVGWSMEDLGKRFPATVLQRDLVSGALSDNAKLAAYLQQVVPCWIGPGMTPVVQVTDTDVAFPLKKIIERKKVEISQEFKEIAILAGRDTSFKMGPPELMKVLCGAVKEFKETADAQQLVLHALRRNGQLAYITLNGKLEKLSEELCPWMSKLGIGDLGSHRYPRSWLEDRFSWTVDGVPVKPDWSELLTKGQQEARKKEKQSEEMQKEKQSEKKHQMFESEEDVEKSEEVRKAEEDAEYQEFILKKLGKLLETGNPDQFKVEHEITVCGKKVILPIFEMEIEGQSNLIPPQLLEIIQQTPAERRAIAARPGELQHWKFSKLVKNQVKKRKGGNRFKLALKPFSPELIEQLAEQLRKDTRKEVFKKLHFVTGGRKRSSKYKQAKNGKQKKVKGKLFAKVAALEKKKVKVKDIG